MRQRRSSGLTLVEVVISIALLAIVLLAFGSLATASVDSTRNTRPNLIANEAVSRVVDRMRTGKVVPDTPPTGDSVYETYFLNYASKVTLGGVQYAAPDLDNPASYAITTPYNDPFADLQLAFRRGLLGRPSDAPARPLRVRFLDEPDYQAMWGLLAPFDLDLDGASTVGVTTNYRIFPVLVELRWRENRGPDRVAQLKAVLAAPSQLDPSR